MPYNEEIRIPATAVVYTDEQGHLCIQEVKSSAYSWMSANKVNFTTDVVIRESVSGEHFWLYVVADDRYLFGMQFFSRRGMEIFANDLKRMNIHPLIQYRKAANDVSKEAPPADFGKAFVPWYNEQGTE